MKPIRTNSKEFNDKVYPYILNAISSSGDDIEFNSDKEKLRYLKDIFITRANYEYNVKRYPNNQERLADWIAGLPSEFNIDFENYRILEIAESWGSLPNPDDEKQQEKIISNWFNLIAFKTIQLMKRHKIYIK